MKKIRLYTSRKRPVFWCFCLVCKAAWKVCLLVERDHIGGNVYCERQKASTYINTVPIFIQVIKKYGSL